MQYGLKRQEKDDRDFQFQYAKVKLPSKVDLQPICPPILNQGDLGSCTANAGVTARQMLSGIQFTLSRLYLYYKEREMNNEVNEDSGATMRDICKALQKYGVCTEKLNPYAISKFTVKPTTEMDTEAGKYKITSYQSVKGTTGIQNFLAKYNQPVLTGIEVHNSFENVGSDGFVKMPKLYEKSLGGHAILITSYFRKGLTWYFTIRNSWGISYGNKGYCYVPFDYIIKHAFDSWGLI